MTARWSGVGELDDVLAELVRTAGAVFGVGLVGVYLHGSFALGGWDAESDCDFVVVTTEPRGHACAGKRPGVLAVLPIASAC